MYQRHVFLLFPILLIISNPRINLVHLKPVLGLRTTWFCFGKKGFSPPLACFGSHSPKTGLVHFSPPYICFGKPTLHMFWDPLIMSTSNLF